jgi:hypothetical protein
MGSQAVLTYLVAAIAHSDNGHIVSNLSERRKPCVISLLTLI